MKGSNNIGDMLRSTDVTKASFLAACGSSRLHILVSAFKVINCQGLRGPLPSLLLWPNYNFKFRIGFVFRGEQNLFKLKKT